MHRNFQKFKCRWGGSVDFWGAPAPPKHLRLRHPWSVRAKIRKKGEILKLFFNLKVYSSNFMLFFCYNFCQLLRFGGTSFLSSPYGATTAPSLPYSTAIDLTNGGVAKCSNSDLVGSANSTVHPFKVDTACLFW